MPCQLPGGELNGISVPSICERHGGTWVAEPSLMQGGITPSDSLLGEDTVIPLPTRKIGKSFSGEAGAGYWDTDAFGQPLDWNTGPQGEQYNLFGERDRILANMNANAFDPEPFTPYEIKRENTSQPRMIKTKHGQRLMTEQEMIKFNQQNAGNKIKSLFTSTGSTQDKKDATSEVTTGTKPTTTTTATDKPTTTTPTTPPAPPAPPGKTVQEMGKTGDIPDSIWEQMKTKDYWLKGVEGGSGGWDNRLFRLGEMMSYMGTPLANRGDSPAKRWQSATLKSKELTASANKKKTTTPLAISTGNVDTFISNTLSEEYQGGILPMFDDMDDETVAGYAGMLAENVRKRVRQIELKNPGKRANIQKIAEDEVEKFKSNYKKK